MSIACTHLSHADARKAGWFSHRHQTAEPHLDTQRARQDRIAQKMERATLEREEGDAFRRKLIAIRGGSAV